MTIICCSYMHSTTTCCIISWCFSFTAKPLSLVLNAIVSIWKFPYFQVCHCSSGLSSELSDTDIDDYAEKAYIYLKFGKLVAILGTDRFRCPFYPRKKKQGYCASKVKANHQALANLLKTDHAGAAGSWWVRQATALINPPKPVQEHELFVWPWMGIFANVPAE